MKYRRSLLVAGLALAASTFAYAAGYFPGFPTVGGPSYCGGNVTAGVPGTAAVCSNTVPAGPTGLTGQEMIPADTELSQGQAPQTVLIPSGLLGQHINRLIGGDFGTNLWQWGTTPISATTTAAATMTADRWWAYSSGNTMTISKQTGANDIITSQGFSASMRVLRPSGTDVTPICVGQTLDKQAAAPLIGNNAVFSFWALAGGSFTPVSSNILVRVAYFTAADSAAPQGTIQYAGGNGQTFALGTTTNYTNAVGGVSNGTTGTVTSGIATIPISTTWTRYAVYAPIPTATAAGTAITGVGVSICATPVGTGVAADWFEITGLQLQAMGGAVNASGPMPNGIISPSGFERRSAALEQVLQYYYAYVIKESATALNVEGSCAGSTTSIANCLITFPVPQRLAAPVAKYTAGFEACATTACTSATVCTALTTSAQQAWAVSNKQVIVDCASSAGTPAAGTAFFLYDIGTGSASGVMSFSSEP